MKETEATHFDVPGINHESTPISVRTLRKKPGTHLAEVPDDEWSIHVSSSWNISLDEWKALARACERAGWNAEVSNNESAIAVW